MTSRPISLLMHRACSSLSAFQSLALLGTLGLGVAACTASAVDVEPPQYQLYFPTGMAVSPDERFLFVVSANSDLRYSAGALHVIDLDQVEAVADAWAQSKSTSGGCKPVPTRPTLLGCEFEDPDLPFMVSGGSAQVGNFSTAVAVQPLRLSPDAPSSLVRVFVTVRGDPSVTWMDFDTSTAMTSCGGSGTFPRCDETHRLARMRNDATLPSLTEEPFSLYVDNSGHVFVAHFTSGYVTLISAPPTVDSVPVLQDFITSLWSPTRATGALGAAGIAARPGDPSGLVYVTSRQEARVALIAVGAGPDNTELLVRTGSFLLSGLEQAGLAGDARSLTFAPDGNRAYLINRTPPSLQIFDTTLEPTGAPKNVLTNIVELCAQPANLALADFGAGPIAAVPCFANGQVWMFDADTLRLLAVEESGRGPNGIAASTTRKKLYIGNYAEDTITVIDVDPQSPTRYRAILRIGKPRAVQGQN